MGVVYMSVCLPGPREKSRVTVSIAIINMYLGYELYIFSKIYLLFYKMRAFLLPFLAENLCIHVPMLN